MNEKLICCVRFVNDRMMEIGLVIFLSVVAISALLPNLKSVKSLAPTVAIADGGKAWTNYLSTEYMGTPTIYPIMKIQEHQSEGIQSVTLIHGQLEVIRMVTEHWMEGDQRKYFKDIFVAKDGAIIHLKTEQATVIPKKVEPEQIRWP